MDLLEYPNHSFESVAKELHLYRQYVINIFDKYYSYSPGELPEIICFDEKHIGKALTDRSYIFIMSDFKEKKIYNILRSRHKDTISQYFSKIPLEKRNKVKYIVMDMWEPYRDVVKIYFKNSLIAVDSFHVMQNMNRVMNKIRTSVMAKFNKGTDKLEDNDIYYYFLKKFSYFLVTDYDDIYEYPIKIPKLKTKWYKDEILNYLLDIDDKIKIAYRLISKYREFNKTARFENCASELYEIIEEFYDSNLPQFIELAKMLYNWKDEIINSFITIDNCYTTPIKKDELPQLRRLSNGCMEGINSRIAQLITNAKGYSNFDRFKNRVIYVINKDNVFKN